MNTNAKRTVMRLVAGVAAVATLMGHRSLRFFEQLFE